MWMMKGILVIIISISVVHSSGHLEIGNLPANSSVFIEDSGGTYLTTFNVYASTSVGTVTCSFNPVNTNFDIAIDSSGDQYHVSTVSSPSLTAGTVTLNIECTDTVVTDTGTVTVTVIDNFAPVYPNGADFGTVDVSVKTGRTNHVILTLSYTDNDTDSPLPHQTILSTTPVPVTTLFNLANDQLTLATDMLDYDDQATYEVEIEIGDERTTSTGTVTVNIIDRNTAPEFLLGANPDVTVSLPEFTSGRYEVYDIDAHDAEGDGIQFTDINTDPNIGAFDLVSSDGGIFLKGGQVLDFESVDKYVFHVTIEDYIDPQTTSTFSLTIEVLDVNEQPTYSATPTPVAIDEAASGTLVGTLDSLCSDPDSDAISYSILASVESPYFTIDPTTAQVTLANNYDYDDTSLANEVNLTVRCSDGRGLYDDTTYTVTIQDINDNNPICNPSVTSFSLNYDQAVSTTLVNMACTDADSTVNAELDYSILGFTSGYSKTYFQVDTSGNVSVSTTFTMDFNTSFFVTILINDRGTPSLSATVTLTVTYTERPTITVYTEVADSECFLCTTSAITLVSVASLFVFVILIYLLVLCVLRSCYLREKRIIRKALSMESKKKKKRTWRWCGCLRPGTLKKSKRAAREIVIAKMKDAEYMRARDALQGTDDPTLRIKDSGPAVKLPPGKAKQKGGKGPRSDSASTSSGVRKMDFMKRDKTPDLSATPVDRSALTSSQKKHLQTFKGSNINSRGVRPPAQRTQAASDMIWTFQGRNT